MSDEDLTTKDVMKVLGLLGGCAAFGSLFTYSVMGSDVGGTNLDDVIKAYITSGSVTEVQACSELEKLAEKLNVQFTKRASNAVEPSVVSFDTDACEQIITVTNAAPTQG